VSLFVVVVVAIVGGRIVGPYFWHFGPKKAQPAIIDTLPPPDVHVSTILASHPA
jgi:hypothetical protein